MEKSRNDLVTFLVGVIMLAAGLYWFTSSITVSTGFYTRFWGFNVGGFVVIPFIAGIGWIFAKPDSMGAKLLLIIGLVVILASVIAGTSFIFNRRNLYEYLIMLISIVGGASLTLKVLLAKPSDNNAYHRDIRTKNDDYDRLQKELDDLKRKLK